MGRYRTRWKTHLTLALCFFLVLLVTWLLLSRATIKAEFSSDDAVCIVIRVSALTTGNLSDTLASLRKLRYSCCFSPVIADHLARNERWTAVVTVTGPAKVARAIVAQANDSRVVLHWPTDDQVRKMHLEGGGEDGSVAECKRMRPDLRWVMYSTMVHHPDPDVLSQLDRSVDIIELMADETPTRPAHKPCHYLGCSLVNDALNFPIAAHLFSYPRLVEDNRLASLAVAAKQQRGNFLKELRANGWLVQRKYSCVHTEDSPGLCWKNGDVWFDSPHPHERRCLATSLVTDLLAMPDAQLDAEHYAQSKLHGQQCLRYRGVGSRNSAE